MRLSFSELRLFIFVFRNECDFIVYEQEPEIEELFFGKEFFELVQKIIEQVDFVFFDGGLAQDFDALEGFDEVAALERIADELDDHLAHQVHRLDGVVDLFVAHHFLEVFDRRHGADARFVFGFVRVELLLDSLLCDRRVELVLDDFFPENALFFVVDLVLFFDFEHFVQETRVFVVFEELFVGDQVARDGLVERRQVFGFVESLGFEALVEVLQNRVEGFVWLQKFFVLFEVEAVDELADDLFLLGGALVQGRELEVADVFDGGQHVEVEDGAALALVRGEHYEFGVCVLAVDESGDEHLVHLAHFRDQALQSEHVGLARWVRDQQVDARHEVVARDSEGVREADCFEALGLLVFEADFVGGPDGDQGVAVVVGFGHEFFVDGVFFGVVVDVIDSFVYYCAHVRVVAEGCDFGVLFEAGEVGLCGFCVDHDVELELGGNDERAAEFCDWADFFFFELVVDVVGLVGGEDFNVFGFLF